MCKELELITIDIEYERREKDIKGILLNYLRKVHPEFNKKNIRFARLGKESKAHKLALAVFRNEIKENKVITTKEIEELL